MNAPAVARPPNIPRNITAEEIAAIFATWTHGLSRHPTGVPFYIETWETQRGWNIYSTVSGGRPMVDIDEGMSQTIPGNPFPKWSPYNGKSMARVLSPGVAGNNVVLWKGFAIPHNLQLGIEAFFAFPYGKPTLDTLCDYFGFGFHYRTGAVAHIAMFYLRPALNVLQAFTSSGLVNIHNFPAAQPFATEATEDLIWHNAKVTVDFSTLKFRDLWFDDLHIDLSAYSPMIVAWWNAPRSLWPVFGFHDVANQQYVTHLGNIILTLEES